MRVAMSLAAGIVLLLLLSVYSTFGVRLGDLGPRGEKRKGEARTCSNVKKVFPWIKCDASNRFSPLQCDPNIRRCFCVAVDYGTRVNAKTYSMKMNDPNICTMSSICPPLSCTKLCKKYQIDPDTGCKTCQCNDSISMCPEADQVVYEQWCPRDCLNKTMNGSMHCIQCIPGCIGGLADDECDKNGSKSDGCDGNGTCVAIGSFSTRICLQPSLLDGDTCKLPPPPKKPDDKHDKKFMNVLHTIKAYKIAGKFEPAKAICQKESVCFPVNGTFGKGVCRSKADIGGPCYNNSQNLKCDLIGRFKPLQCFKNHSQCWCVDPINGTEINNTRIEIDEHSCSKPPKCIDKIYKKCTTSFRNFQYKVEHDHYGVDTTSCRKCICENGQFNQSTCDHSHNCSLLTYDSTGSCDMDGQEYNHQQVFPVDKCNKCKCLGGKISGCTRRQCMDGDDAPCDKCRKLPRKPVCGPNGVTYDNICSATYCAGFDPLEVTPGPCSIQNPCDNVPCEKELTCVPKRKACGLRRGCHPEQHRHCVNKTELACPVDHDVSDEYKICGTDNRTYESLCRMILETEGVEVLFDGPCNRNDCRSVVCGTDGVTYPNTCVLHSISPNVRIDYPGTCLHPLVDEIVDEFCERVRKSHYCKIPMNCTHIIKPTDGCCPICGGAVSIAIDEDGLAQLAEVAAYEITQDALIEAVLINVIASNGSIELLYDCDIEGYIASTGNLEIIFRVKNTGHEDECAAAAEDVSQSVNNQENEASDTTTTAAMVSFLTAGSVLEEEVSLAVNSTDAENEAKSLLPPFIIVLTIITAIFIMN